MSNWRKKGKTGGRKNTSKMMEVEGKWKIIGVLFIQHTQNSELAKRLRGKLEILEKVGNIKLKIVERTGEKIVDLVHRSNAWSNLDCQRKDCLICESCVGEEMRGMCYKRNVIYETFCLTCEDKVEERNGVDIVNEENEEVESGGKRKRLEVTKEIGDRKEGNVKRDFKVKYVGESGRSGYERGNEHRNMFKRLDEGSHLLKHYLIYHQDIPKEEMRFGMRVRNVFKTSLERQVGEAVAIDYEMRLGKLS